MTAGYTRKKQTSGKASKDFSSAGYRAAPPTPKKKSGILSKLLLAALLAGGAWAAYNSNLDFGGDTQPQPSKADCNQSIGNYFANKYHPAYQENQYPQKRVELDGEQRRSLAIAVDNLEDIKIKKYDGLLLTRQETAEVRAMHRKLIEAFHSQDNLTEEDAEIYAIKQLQIDLDRMRGTPRGDFSTPEGMLAVQLRETKYRAGSPYAVKDIATMNASPPKYRYARSNVLDNYAVVCPSPKRLENN